MNTRNNKSVAQQALSALLQMEDADYRCPGRAIRSRAKQTPAPVIVATLRARMGPMNGALELDLAGQVVADAVGG